MSRTDFKLSGRAESNLRIFLSFGLAVLALSIAASIIKLPPAEPDFSFNWYILVPVTHGIVFILTIILLFFPASKSLLLVVLSMEGILCVFVERFGLVSCIFLNIIIEVLFAWGWFRNHGYRKVAFIYVIYLLFLIPISREGWDIYFFSVGFSLFTVGSSLFVYTLIKDRLSYYVPQMTRLNEILAGTNELPKYGEHIRLSDYGFTERQIKCAAYAIRDNMTYPKIAETMGISLSIVKREMAIVCRQFAVNNRDELYLLFIQYKVDYGL